MSYQTPISTISGTAPPSYMEAIGQTHPPKDGFPVSSPMPQPYGSFVQPVPSGGQYSMPSANYQEYNASQPPYNPMFVSPTPVQVTSTVPVITQPNQRPCVVTATVVRRKRGNRVCFSCMRMILLTIIILIVVFYLLKIIIASTSH